MAREIIDDLLPSLKRVFLEQDGLRSFLLDVIQQAMSVEVQQHLNAGPHQRTEDRQGYRNGNKPRRLNTRVGELELSVPQVRGCEPYRPSAFGKWQRSERALLVACGEMYFQGVSTRNVTRVLEAMCCRTNS
jgi:transposase-like protein